MMQASGGKFLGVSLVLAAVGVGGMAVYQCSPKGGAMTRSDSRRHPASGTSPQTSSVSSTEQPGGNPLRQQPLAPASSAGPRNDLAAMRTLKLRVGSRAMTVWIAMTMTEQENGLMNIQPGEVADNQGMLFVFAEDQTGGFWMRDTLMPLDIAFIRGDGVVLDVQQMKPLTLDEHRPSVPYRLALEVNAGVLGRAGLAAGQTIEIPSWLLNQP